MDGMERLWLGLAFIFAILIISITLINQRGNMDIRDKLSKATTCEAAVILAHDLNGSGATSDSTTVRLMMCKINPMTTMQEAKAAK